MPGRCGSVGNEQSDLIAALRSWGIRYLSGGSPEESPPWPSADVLITQLAAAAPARLRQALTSLFILHPELADIVPDVAARLPAAARAELMHRYMAAVYLQRLWLTRLRRQLGTFRLLPALWQQELALPAPTERHGKVGLCALALHEQRRTGRRINHWASYHKHMSLLLEQLRHEGVS